MVPLNGSERRQRSKSRSRTGIPQGVGSRDGPASARPTARLAATKQALEASASPADRGHGIRGLSHKNAEWVSGRVGEHIQGFILVVGAVEQFSGTES